MLLLEHDDIAGLLTPEEVIEALREALIEESKDLVQGEDHCDYNLPYSYLVGRSPCVVLEPPKYHANMF